MSQTPSAYSCPPYIPATQITPDSVDEIPTQENTLFTQESRKILFDTVDFVNNQSNDRNYYDQLFSSDSEDEESEENNGSSDMSISESENSSQPSSDGIHNSRNYHDQLFSSDSETNKNDDSSDTSISNSENSMHSSANNINYEQSFTLGSICDHSIPSNSDMSVSDESSTSSSSDVSSSSIDSENSISNESCNSLNYFNPDGDANNDICGITQLLEEKEIDDLLGVHDILRPPPKQEVLPKSEIDKIGSFNIRNKYDHDIAAFFMMKEDLSFLAIQEPFPATTIPSHSWTSYRKSELESARISCYETPFQIILFDSWKWGGKIISPFQSTHHGRATSIAFQFSSTQSLGIISVYASTQECALQEKDDEHKKISSLTSSVRKMVKELHHNFPGICVIILGDLQETISTSDKDNLGTYRKEYKSNGILANFISTHSSIVRDLNPDPNYITRFGEVGGRGIDHILFPTDAKYTSWIASAKIERNSGATFFPSDHSYINCSIHRQGCNNNQDSPEVRRFDFKKVCNIKLKKINPTSEDTEFMLDESQFKECESFISQKKLYNKIQTLTNSQSSLSEYYLNETEARINKLYKDLWREGIKQQVNGAKNKLVVINDDHAAELSFILRKFQTGVKDVMTHLDCFKDTNLNGTAGRKRERLRRENGFHFTKNSPIQTKLRYLRIASKLQLHRLQQILYFCKEYRIRNYGADTEFDFSSIDNTWGKILSENKIHNQALHCHQNISDELFTREKHIDAIAHEKEKHRSHSVKPQQMSPMQEKMGNRLPNTSDSLTSLINHWLISSNCNHPFNHRNAPTNAYSFLKDDVSSYREPIKDLDIKTMIAGTLEDVRNFYSSIQSSINILKNFENKIIRAQFWFKHATLTYLLETNSIDQFSTKLMQKDRSAPETHNVIWDSTTQSMRKCRNEYEELIATSAHHNNWMANSKAKEVCAFAKLKRVGKLGIRGIELSPNRIITEKDIPNLIHNGNKLSKEMKTSFISAHGKHTASLFTPPEKDLEELFYPFYLDNAKGKMNEESNLKSDFNKAIGSVPSKARFNGFHMATIGRFGVRWQKTLLNIIKLILLLRYIPTDLKKMARFPIPKPGKINEYRPISLCHDIYCFVNGICTKITSKGIERAGFLHDGIVAYRPGKGCGSLVTIEQSFREDCREHSTPTAQVDEDEEKFFDRIPVEILLAAMRINGFPEQGFLEIKASGMGAKYVDIITKKGIAYAKFVCGLEQGNPDSPTVANLVIKLKHDVWNFISEKVAKIYEKNKSSQNGKYRFNSIDKIDGEVILCKIGYCDDNSKFCFINDENDLLYLTNYFLQLAGDLSMVTKIGRKGSKSEIQFYNVSADFAIKIRKCISSAWSFVHDSPTQEEVPIKICLKKSEMEKFLILSDYENLEQEDQEKWDSIIFPKAHRHLGLTATLSGITKETSRKTLSKMNDRIKKLKIPHMHHEAQVKAFNMLCSSIHSFVPLQIDYDSKELENIDRAVVKQIRKSRGLSSSDAKHSIFLPTHMGGMGFNSIQDIDITSVARELEITSNSNSIDSEAFRTRIAAILQYNDEELEDAQNHAWNAIKKLAHFGIYFRDHTEHELNKIFVELEKLPKYQGIGSGRFKNGNQPYLGKGKAKNLDIMYGGVIHRILLKLQAAKWDLATFKIKHKEIKSPISLKRLLKIRKQIATHSFEELTAYFSCYEWINLNGSKEIPKKASEWRYIDISKSLKDKFPTSYWKLSNEEISDEARKILSLEDTIIANETVYNKTPNHSYNHSIIWNKIMKSQSPVFVATDGSHRASDSPHPSTPDINTNHHSASSFVICQADMENTTVDWTHLPCIPLLCRISSLPKTIGTAKSNVAHAESHAIAMQEWAIPNYIPRILITDSESVRNVCLELREIEDRKINRVLIRKLFGGISKFITSDIFTHLQQCENPHHHANISSSISNMISTLEARIESVIARARTWTSPAPMEDENDIPATYGIWRKDYCDDSTKRPIFKINSHQLDETGQNFNKTKRYPKLNPNLSLLNMNHHADEGAELGQALFQGDSNSTRRHLHNPPSVLRFFYSWEGTTVDTHVSDFIRTKISLERLSRLKTKKTQGLLWRAMDHVSATWEEIGHHKGWRRSLMGLSKTHTRSLYKSETYRSGCHLELESTAICHECDKSIPIKQKDIIRKCSSCMWCPEFHTKSCPEGNRNHLFLQCQHPDLQSFRTKMTNIIEQKLRILLLQIRRATDNSFIIKLLENLENECLNLQLKTLFNNKPNKVLQKGFTYIKIEELLQKYEITNLQEGFHVQGPFFSEAFGILPQSIAKNIKDENLKLIDVFWLGLTPITIDRIMKSNCSHLQFLQYSPDVASCKAFSNDCLSTWTEIKELLMAKAIGIHRIISTISKEKEKSYRKKYNLIKGTYMDPIYREDMNRKRKRAQISPETMSKDESGILEATVLEEHSRKVLCNGITCSKKNKRWCLDQQFTSNRIDPSKKHCLRCSRFSTSMKHSANILDSIGKNTVNANLKQLQSSLYHAASNGIPYRSMMNMLEENKLPSEPITGATFNKKLKITDNQKTICRIITHSFKTANTTNTNNDHDKFIATATKIRKGLTNSQEILKQPIAGTTISSEAEKITNITSETTHDIIELHTPPTSSQNSKCTTPAGPSKNLERLQNQILTDGEFVSDDAITMAVEVLRQDTEQHNVFIANGLANLLIDTWSSTAGWERFGKIFNSQIAIFSKPNGTYIIPMYRPGHWYLVVVRKINRNTNDGWIFDSLRKGDPNTDLHIKIKEAFTGSRGNFNWHTPQCRPQTENECGPRTIRSIVDIIKGIRNSVSIADHMDRIAMWNDGNNTYDAKILRRDMASLINLHSNEMRPRRIRFRQTATEIKNASQKKRTKFKRNRRRGRSS